MEKREPVRINTRISANLNDWLDERSQEVSVSKSALINMAIENYRKETEAIKVLPQILKTLQDLGIEIDGDSGARIGLYDGNDN